MIELDLLNVGTDKSAHFHTQTYTTSEHKHTSVTSYFLSVITV
jgi:hypothetical protein